MVKQGYKQTDIGVIPEDWEVICLGDFIKLKNGYAFPSENFSDKGPIVMTPGNFKLEGGLKFSSDKTIRYKGSYSKEMQFSNGDLVMVMTDLTPDCNLLGKSGIIDTSEVVLHNQRIGKIICSELINPKYLSFYFNSKAFSFRMKSTATGSTVRHTSTPTIKNTVLILPPLAEQEAIASALSDADAWIDSLEQLIAKKRLIKQGAMQTLLTPKENWEVKKLGEVCEFFKGKDLPKSDLSSNGKYECIHYGELFTNYRESINYVKSYTNNNLNKILSRSNDVLMPTSDVTPRGLATASCIKKDGVILGGDILIIRFQEGFDGVYFSYFISNNREEVLKYVSGSTVYHLYGSELSNLIFSFPSLSEQERIATILSDMDAELEALATQLGKARQIKQGMMQELLTGRTRLV